MKILQCMVVVGMAIGLGGCGAGHADTAAEGFDVGSFIRNPYPRHAHPGSYAEPHGSQVPEQTYRLPSGPAPANAIGWVRPYDHIPFNAQARVREVKNCPPESTYARMGDGIFCAYPENRWFADCVNDQWLATRYRNPRVWVVHRLQRVGPDTWLETYPQDKPDGKTCRILLNPKHRGPA